MKKHLLRIFTGVIGFTLLAVGMFTFLDLFGKANRNFSQILKEFEIYDFILIPLIIYGIGYILEMFYTGELSVLIKNIKI